MRLNHKSCRAMICSTILLWIAMLFPVDTLSQDSGATSPKILVGVVVAPPVYIKTADNRWEGLSIEVWQAVAQSMGVEFEIREFGTFERLLEALENKEIDVIPALGVEERLESTFDFSQSYLKSGLSIAVPAEATRHRYFKTIENIFSPHVLKAIGLLFVMSLIFGLIVWIFERQRNRDMFGDGYVKGIGHGIWWAIVTMTTVGYGDKAPKTMGGRIFALIWMIFSVVFIASFTANITTQLTISELHGKVRGFNDLYEVRVGSILGSEGLDFLVQKGVSVIPYQDLREGVSAVVNHEIEAFVQDEKVLNYLAKNEFPGRLQVVGGPFDEYFVSIALQPNSPLRKPINKALLRFMDTESWAKLLHRYIK